MKGFLRALVGFSVSVLSFVILPAGESIPQLIIDSSQADTTVDAVTIDDYHPRINYGNDDDDDDPPLPVVIWHGLGDSIDNQGLKDMADLVADIHPGTYVHLISLKSESYSDAYGSWFGNINDQIESICQQLAKDPILSTAPAIDAIGFSQGGQFLRGYIERCGHWAPQVRTLITFGSQHNGIAEFQKCSGWGDLLCLAANALLESGIVWGDFIQGKVIPAQYYRPANDWDNYLAHSNFIADINNERALKNTTYADNLARLEKFIMIMFENDTVAIPKESAWFAEVDLETSNVTSLRQTKQYQEDWIGLKRLDDKGALVFDKVEGQHMQLKEKDLKRFFKAYLGPVTSTRAMDRDRRPEL